MSDHTPNQEPNPLTAELTNGQKELHNFCNVLLSPSRGERRLSFVDFPLTANAAATEKSFRAGQFGALLVANGESFAMESGDDYYGDINFKAGDVPPAAVGIRAWEWFEDKRRIDPAGPTMPPYDLIEYPGVQDWIHQLDVSFYYQKENQMVVQTLSTYGSSYRRDTPAIYRTLYAIDYMETGYEHHGYVGMDASDNDVRAFISQAQDLLLSRQISSREIL